MAVRPYLVVSGTDDDTAPDAHRRLRLEHRCGLGTFALAHRTSRVRSCDGLHFPFSSKPLHALAEARSADCRTRAEAVAAAGDSGASSVIPGFGFGCAAANPSRLNK